MDQGKIDEQIAALHELGRQVRELHVQPSPAGSQRNEQHFTLHAGHWITHLFTAVCFACACVTAVLSVTAKSDWNADKARMEREIDALRNKVETQQAYVNEIYRSLKR